LNDHEEWLRTKKNTQVR